MMTPYMLRSTVSVPCACGDNDTINLLIVLFTIMGFTIYYLFLSSAAADDTHDGTLSLTDVVEKRTVGRTGELT